MLRIRTDMQVSMRMYLMDCLKTNLNWSLYFCCLTKNKNFFCVLNNFICSCNIFILSYMLQYDYFFEINYSTISRHNRTCLSKIKYIRLNSIWNCTYTWLIFLSVYCTLYSKYKINSCTRTNVSNTWFFFLGFFFFGDW